MKSIRRLSLSISLILMCNVITQAQGFVSRIIKNDNSYSIDLKWFSDNIYPDGEYILYKRTMNNNNWVKIDNTKLVKGNYYPDQLEFQKDTNLINFVDAAKNITRKDMKGFIKAMMLVETAQNNAFAKYMACFYSDKEVQKDVSYQYQLKERISGIEKEVFTSNWIKCTETDKLAAVQEIEIRKQKRTLFFRWKPEPFRYFAVNIYRKKGTETNFTKRTELPVLISERKGPDGKVGYPEVFFKDDSLKIGETYTYILKGIDFFGEEIKESQEFRFTIGDDQAPPAPLFLKAKAKSGNVQLSWTPQASDDLVGFDVYRGKSFAGDYSKINDLSLGISQNVFIDSTVGAGEYYYYVSAIDSVYNEGKSAKITVRVYDVKAPERPKNLVCKADTGVIKMHWSPNTESDLLGYRVFRTVNKNKKKNFVLLNAVPIKDTIFTDSLPKVAKNKFLYCIAAVDTSYNVSEFSFPGEARMPDITPPEKPFIKLVNQENSSVVIHWLANVENDLKGYYLYRYTQEQDSSLTFEILNEKIIPKNQRYYTDYFTDPNTLYKYALVATDSSNNKSEKSDLYPIKTKKIIEDIGKIDFYKLKYQRFRKQIVLKWEYKGNKNVKTFLVFCKHQNNIPVSISNKLSKNTYRDKRKFNLNSSYQYQIRAYFEDGSICKSKFIEVEIPKKLN